jgi:hypothetical protein
MNIEIFIKSIRESFGASIAVYTQGNCYQFYEILKTVYPDAIAYEDGNHVWTKIDDDFYDIRGKNSNIKKENLTLVSDNDRIFSLSVNKWSDERRIELKNNTIKKYEKK